MIPATDKQLKYLHAIEKELCIEYEGEYFHREQCAELLEFLNELKKRRNEEG